MKVTKRMVIRAENNHERTETYPSLVKSHALNYLFYKQRNKMSIARQFLTGNDVKRKVKQLENKTIRKKTKFNPFYIPKRYGNIGRII
jgi:hypothetical protein